MIDIVNTAQFPDFPQPGFGGEVMRPGDVAYKSARTVWNARHDKQIPALIARCADQADVVTAVKYANRCDIPFAVRSGGHGIDGFAMPDGAFVIDMSLMKHIEVDPVTEVVRFQAGVTLGELDAATQAYGLAVPCGTATTTGAAGLTLGGGLGYLTRRFGMTVDNLKSVDVVTADGRALTASADENPELFWGLKGAGANLAVVTSFEVQAYPVGPDVVAGMVMYPLEAAIPILQGLDDALAKTPRELVVYAVLTHAPPVPGLPPEVIGAPIFVLLVVYTGPVDEFEQAAAPVLALGPEPLADLTRRCTWCETQAIIDPIAPPGRRQNSRGGYLTGVGGQIGALVVDMMRQAPVPPPGTSGGAIALELLGGASNEFDENSAAYSRVGSQWLWVVMGSWDEPEDDPIYDAWTHGSAERFEPYSLSNAYVNLSETPSARWLTQLYGAPEKWQRLCQLKEHWDPDNRLRYNKNIVWAQREVAASSVSAPDH